MGGCFRVVGRRWIRLRRLSRRGGVGGVVPRLFLGCVLGFCWGWSGGRVERGWSASSPPVRKRWSRVLAHRVLMPKCVAASLMLMPLLTMARTTARLREYVIPQLACSGVFEVNDVVTHQ